MWFFTALFSSVIYSWRGILEKKYIKDINKYILAFCVRFFALPFIVLPLFIKPELINEITTLNTQFWLATLYISFISTPIEMLLFYAALKREEVSYVMPLMAISPLFVSLFSIIILNEFPSTLGMLGMLIIISAIYFLNVSRAKKGLLEPIKYLAKNSAARFIMAMIFFYSSSTVIDKIALINSNVYLYAILNYIFVSLSLLILALIKARDKFWQIKKYIRAFSIIGLIVATYTFFRFFALDNGNTAYVAAVMSSSIFFTVLFGSIFLKEKNLKIKLFVSILLIIGLGLVKLFG